MLETVKAYGYKRVWGEHSLTIGETIGILVAAIIMLWHFGWKNLWVWLILAIIVVSAALF